MKRENFLGSISSIFRTVVPNLFGTRIGLMENDFSTDQGEGNGFGMTQVHYVY